MTVQSSLLRQKQNWWKKNIFIFDDLNKTLFSWLTLILDIVPIFKVALRYHLPNRRCLPRLRLPAIWFLLQNKMWNLFFKQVALQITWQRPHWRILVFVINQCKSIVQRCKWICIIISIWYIKKKVMRNFREKKTSDVSDNGQSATPSHLDKNDLNSNLRIFNFKNFILRDSA